MKKFLSIFLAAILMFATVSCAVLVFAEEGTAEAQLLDITNYTSQCTCANHTGTADCKCCSFCPTTAKRLACVHAIEVYDPEGVPSIQACNCCGACSGWLGCTCGDSETCDCEYCKAANQDSNGNYDGPVQIIDSDTQRSIVKVFQNVLSKVSAVFDKIFDAIYEFLRIADFF